MSDALSDGLASLRDHLPSASSAKDAVASAKDARDAVRDHLPSRDDIDVTALTDRLSNRKPGKRGLIAIAVALFATAGALLVRRRVHAATSASVPPSIYTPPLPKP